MICGNDLSDFVSCVGGLQYVRNRFIWHDRSMASGRLVRSVEGKGKHGLPAVTNGPHNIILPYLYTSCCFFFNVVFRTVVYAFYGFTGSISMLVGSFGATEDARDSMTFNIQY